MAHELDDDLGAALLDYASRTSDFVGIVDDKGVVVYLNEAARKRLGLGDAESLTTGNLFPPAEFTRYYDEIRPCLLADGRWSGELLLATPAGDDLALVEVGLGGRRESGGGISRGLVVQPSGGRVGPGRRHLPRGRGFRRAGGGGAGAAQGDRQEPDR